MNKIVLKGEQFWAKGEQNYILFLTLFIKCSIILYNKEIKHKKKTRDFLGEQNWGSPKNTHKRIYHSVFMGLKGEQNWEKRF